MWPALQDVTGDHGSLAWRSGALHPFKTIQSIIAIHLIEQAGFVHCTRDVIIAAKPTANGLSVKSRDGDVFGLCSTNRASYWFQIGHSGVLSLMLSTLTF